MCNTHMWSKLEFKKVPRVRKWYEGKKRPDVYFPWLFGCMGFPLDSSFPSHVYMRRDSPPQPSNPNQPPKKTVPKEIRLFFVQIPSSSREVVLREIDRLDIFLWVPYTTTFIHARILPLPQVIISSLSSSLISRRGIFGFQHQRGGKKDCNYLLRTLQPIMQFIFGIQCAPA